MKAIIKLFKRVLDLPGQFFNLLKNLLRKMRTGITWMIQRGTFALPRDEVEKLEVLHSIYKTLTIVLALTVLFAGVWLDQHGYPSWTALLLFALRLLYALPAKRVERALRKHQYEERQKARTSSPRHT